MKLLGRTFEVHYRMSKLEGPLIAVYKRNVLAGFSFRFSLLFFSIGRTSVLPDTSDEYGGF